MPSRWPHLRRREVSFGEFSVEGSDRRRFNRSGKRSGSDGRLSDRGNSETIVLMLLTRNVNVDVLSLARSIFSDCCAMYSDDDESRGERCLRGSMPVINPISCFLGMICSHISISVSMEYHGVPFETAHGLMKLAFQGEAKVTLIFVTFSSEYFPP